MDPITGLIGAGVSLIDGLIYTPQEQQRDQIALTNAQTAQQQAAASLAIAEARNRTTTTAIIVGGAVAVLAIGGWLIVKAID